MDPLTFAEDVEQRRKKSMLPLAMAQSPGGTLTSAVQPGQALPMSLRARLGKVYKDLEDVESTDVDTSALQAFAKQQGEAGQSAMLNAMAAQYAGESFQPVQAQYLKRAAAAQEPMKLGAGMLTPDGQYLKDPFAARDARRAALERQAAGLTSEIGRQEDRARDDERQAARDRETAAWRRDSLDLRRDLAASRPVDNSKTWRAEDTLRGDFDKLTKDLREEISATGKIVQIVGATPPGQKPDAITQQSLVILLNKFLDPGSVVREGEFDRVVKAQGLIGQATNLADRILKGEPLNADTIKQINGLASMYQQAADAKMRGIASNYIDMATRRGLSVESVISDPRYRSGAPAPSAGGGDKLSPAERAELRRLRERFNRAPGG